MHTTTNAMSTAVTINDLRGLGVSDQFEKLVSAGYQKAGPIIGHITLDEWNAFEQADTENNILYSATVLLECEKAWYSFILMDQEEKVIDEYEYVEVYCWLDDPAEMVINGWIHGGDPEEFLVMPNDPDRKSNGMWLRNINLATPFVTRHEARCLEEAISSDIEDGYYSICDTLFVVELQNGRYAIACDPQEGSNAENRTRWEGIPVCGDGDIHKYCEELLTFSMDKNPREYEIGRNDSMTFATAEEARAWAEQVGYPLAEGVAE